MQKKQYQKDQQKIKYFDKLYTKSLQVNLIDENEKKSQCGLFTTFCAETKNEAF